MLRLLSAFQASAYVAQVALSSAALVKTKAWVKWPGPLFMIVAKSIFNAPQLISAVTCASGSLPRLLKLYAECLSFRCCLSQRLLVSCHLLGVAYACIVSAAMSYSPAYPCLPTGNVRTRGRLACGKSSAGNDSRCWSR